MPLPPNMRRIETGPRPANRSADGSLSMLRLWQQAPAGQCDRDSKPQADSSDDESREDSTCRCCSKGSCRCGAVRFAVESHTPVPYQLCYCSICRKQQGGGGFAINLGADSDTLKITGKRHLGALSRRDRGRRASALRGLDRRAALLQQMRLGAMALRSDLAGARPSLRLGHRQRAAEAARSACI